MIELILALAIAAIAPAPAATNDYRVGQVWAYRTRPEDEGSLLKIQQIERDPAAAEDLTIYHISVIGVHYGTPRMRSSVQHMPVSRQTLDASVTNLVDSDVEFPSPAEGITLWREARGGVFTIPVAEAVALFDRHLSGAIR